MSAAGGSHVGERAFLQPPLREVASALAAAPWQAGEEPVVVAVSGGIDSMCLLHLLRFHTPTATSRLHVAHFDHRMRGESGEHARWLAGVSRAWGLQLHQGAAKAPLSTEAEAREARYAFLAEVKARAFCAAVLTGHTADDQAETVLFRAARGSGPDGLAGVQPARRDGVERPLIRVWRTEIEAYARQVGLPFREDPTNLDVSWTRNRIRREILPALEAAVPGAKASLARLAELSLGQRTALRELASVALDLCTMRRGPEGDTLVLDMTVLDAWSDPAVAQVLREAGRRMGVVLGSGAVGRSLALIRKGREGSSVDLVAGRVATRSAGVPSHRYGGRACGEGTGAGHSRSR